MASFPSSVKSFATIVDGADSVLAAHQNERGDEITAIETWLLAYHSRVHTVIDGMKLTWNSATSITVGIGACYAENGDWIDATSAITKSSLSLSTSTLYHVYVYLSGGTPAAEVVTTAPTAWKGTAYSKTGDTSRRYVGSIRTDGSSNVIPFVHHIHSGLVTYYGVNMATVLRALSNGQASTATAISLSSYVPATSRMALLRLGNTESSQTCYTGPSSSVSSSVYHFLLSTTTTVLEASVPLSSSQQYYYLYSSTPSGGLYVDVQGYYFER